MRTEIDNDRLNSLRKPLKDALEGYEEYLGAPVRFEDFPDFVLTPEKPNTARTIVPVSCSGRKAGDLYAILFQEGDGTGDAKTYSLGQLKVPDELKYREKPERVLPRAKTGVICEGFFPMFSMRDSKPVMFTACLDELGIDSLNNPVRVVRAWYLGQGPTDYLRAVYMDHKTEPQVYFTVGNDKRGRRFGDPHSIHYGTRNVDALQVAGFLAINDRDNPLLPSTQKWILPPGYQ